MQQLQPVRHKMQEILAFNRLEAVQVGLCTGQQRQRQRQQRAAEGSRGPGGKRGEWWRGPTGGPKTGLKRHCRTII